MSGVPIGSHSPKAVPANIPNPAPGMVDGASHTRHTASPASSSAPPAWCGGVSLSLSMRCGDDGGVKTRCGWFSAVEKGTTRRPTTRKQRRTSTHRRLDGTAGRRRGGVDDGTSAVISLEQARKQKGGVLACSTSSGGRIDCCCFLLGCQ